MGDLPYSEDVLLARRESDYWNAYIHWATAAFAFLCAIDTLEPELFGLFLMFLGSGFWARHRGKKARRERAQIKAMKILRRS
jgi:hypothetical protein